MDAVRPAVRTILAAWMLVIALLPGLGGPVAVQAQVVDAALQRDGQGCQDGVGSSYRADELREALDNGTLNAFLARRSACGPGGAESFGLSASCAPDQTSDVRGFVDVFCLVSVWNPSGDSLLLTNDQFTLASNVARYPVDETLLDDEAVADTLEGGLPVATESADSGVIAFQLPAEDANDDFVLIWKLPDPYASPSPTRQRLQIVLGERESDFEAVPAPVANVIQPGAFNGRLQFTGASNLVNSPVELGAGLYRVTARYSGVGPFTVSIQTDTGEDDQLISTVGAFSGQTTFRLDATEDVAFAVTGSGRWEILVTRVAG
ncbi:MAG: hypothetical protein QM692_07295 [Thermomicrobiales bacterium]